MSSISDVKEPNFEFTKRLEQRWLQFNQLIDQLRERELPDEIVEFINAQISELQKTYDDKKAFSKQLTKAQSKTLHEVSTKLKLLVKGHYLGLGMTLGMSVFGLPIGVALSFAIDNMAFIGIGLPFGMIIGMLLALSYDNKAKQEGRQLDISVNKTVNTK